MKRFSLALLALLMFAVAAFAQSNTGNLVGTVSDVTGVIPNATVTVVDNKTNREKTIQTNDQGAYSVSQLETGEYTVKVTAPGHKTYNATAVKIDVGQDYSLNPVLDAGDIAENVTVVAGADIVNTSNGELTNTVSPRQIQELPLNGRNPLTLIQLQSGTANNGAVNTSINGQRPSFTNITRDGLNIQDAFIRSNASDFAPERPSVDNTAEFTLTTQNASADKGGSSQAQLVTPRGQNDFHGAVFEYNRNSHFAANSYFNNLNKVARPFRNRNQFGGRIGGPIIKDKLFFFGFYEEVRDKRSSNQLRTVLTPSARAGTFTFLRADNGQTQTVNLFSLLPAGGTTPTGIDPIIQSRFLANIPLGNSTGTGDQRNTTGFAFAQGQDLKRRQFTTRIDYDINDRNSVNVVYTFTNENNLRPDVDQGGSGFLVGGGGFGTTPEVVQPAPNRFLALAYRTTLSANFTNEVRGGYFNSSPTFNRTSALPAFFLQTPTIGGSSLGNPEVIFQDQGRFTKYQNIQDNAEYTTGDHAFRFGGQLQRFKVNPFGPGAFGATTIPTFTTGVSTATPQLTAANFTSLGGVSSTQLADANALFAFLGGIVSSSSLTFNAASQTSGFLPGTPPNRTLRYNNISFYAADQWKLRPSFTINYGVRYELFTPIRETGGLALEAVIPNGVDPVTALLDPNATLAFVGGNAGKTNNYFKSDHNNFAPIVSFAYAPNFKNKVLGGLFPGGGKTSIRGGYRVSFVNDEFVRAADNLNSNAGLQSTASAINPATLTSSLNARLNALPTIAAPAFQVPRTFAQNFLLGGRGANSSADIIAIDPNLQISKSHEYNLSIEREIGFQTAIKVQYVGGLSNNLVRGINLNQVVLQSTGFLTDFNRALNNLNLSTALRAQQIAAGTLPANAVAVSAFFNAAVPGTVQTQIFGTGAGAGLRVADSTPGAISTATFNSGVLAGTPADLAFTFITNNARNGFPFTPNPNARDIILLNNSGKYRYNSFQFEIRRRFSKGLALQANYTFQKTLTNAQGVGQTRIDPLLDNNRPELDYVRADYDQTHVVNINGFYELPFGKGKRFLNEGGLLNRLVGGFQITGILRAGTGAPITITDSRGTLNRTSLLSRTARQTPNTNLTKAQLRELFGIRRIPSGVIFVDNRVIGFGSVDPLTASSGVSGRGANGFGTPNFAGQVFFNALPGQTGNLERAFINGPDYYNVDASLIKNIAITERVRFQIRMEAFNLFNRANFFVGNTINVNSTAFGRVTSTFDPRVVQFAGRVEF